MPRSSTGSAGKEAGHITTPKISIGSWAFSFGPFETAPWSFERFLEFAAKYGYDGVEINGFRPHPHDADFNSDGVRSVAASIADRGLGISAYAPDLTGTPPGKVAARVYLNRIRSIGEFSTAAGIDTVRVDTMAHPTGRAIDMDDYRRLIGTWRASADLLESIGVLLVWEFEPGFWINRPSDVQRVLEDVDHPNFGLLFDSSHAHTIAAFGKRQGPEPEILEDGAVGFARLVKPWIRHLHLIDSDGTLHNEETSVHMPFGQGNVNFRLLLSELGEVAAQLPWWTADYCFWPTSEVDAQLGASQVRGLRDALLRNLRHSDGAS